MGGRERGKGKRKDGEEVVVDGSGEGERACVKEKDGKGPAMAEVRRSSDGCNSGGLGRCKEVVE